MPGDVHLNVEGAAELGRALRRAGDRDLLAALTAANETAAEIVQDEALPDAPFRKGGLRSSMQVKASSYSGRVVAGVPYAMAIHWGRKRGNVGSPPGNHKGPNVIKGRPFIWDAAQRSIPKIEPEYRDEVLRIIELAMRSAT